MQRESDAALMCCVTMKLCMTLVLVRHCSLKNFQVVVLLVLIIVVLVCLALREISVLEQQGSI